MKVKIVCNTYCPGAEGVTTWTTYSVVPSTGMGHPEWEGEAESEFTGQLFEQVFTSSKWTVGSTFSEPEVNPKAPLGLVNIALGLAAKNWRCKV